MRRSWYHTKRILVVKSKTNECIRGQERSCFDISIIYLFPLCDKSNNFFSLHYISNNFFSRFARPFSSHIVHVNIGLIVNKLIKIILFFRQKIEIIYLKKHKKQHQPLPWMSNSRPLTLIVVTSITIKPCITCVQHHMANSNNIKHRKSMLLQMY